MAFNANGGRSRSAGSATARRIANGILLFTAHIGPAIRLSMSTAGRFRGAAQFRLGGGGRDRSVGSREALDGDGRAGAAKALRKRRRDGLVGSDRRPLPRRLPSRE